LEIRFPVASFRHAEVLLCVDVFTKEVWTLSGLSTAYVLFVLHLGGRRLRPKG
jgi:hypothetical protein